MARIAEMELERLKASVSVTALVAADGAAPHLSGLIDPATLTAASYDARRSGVEESRSPAGRDVVGGRWSVGD